MLHAFKNVYPATAYFSLSDFCKLQAAGLEIAPVPLGCIKMLGLDTHGLNTQRALNLIRNYLTVQKKIYDFDNTRTCVSLFGKLFGFGHAFSTAISLKTLVLLLVTYVLAVFILL